MELDEVQLTAKSLHRLDSPACAYEFSYFYLPDVLIKNYSLVASTAVLFVCAHRNSFLIIL